MTLIKFKLNSVSTDLTLSSNIVSQQQEILIIILKWSLWNCNTTLTYWVHKKIKNFYGYFKNDLNALDCTEIYCDISKSYILFHYKWLS